MIKFLIYKIVYENKILYVGSTRLTLNNRKAIHKYYSTRKNTKLYRFIKENDCFNDLEFIEIMKSQITNNNKDKIHEIEQTYMDLLHPTLNERRSYVSILRNPNFTMNDYQKKYRSFIVNCECGANVMMSSLYNHKKSKKHIKFEKICIKI